MKNNSLKNIRVLVTGASGIAGQKICQVLAGEGAKLRLADVTPPPAEFRGLGEFVRCDTRTPADARRAVAGMGAVVHLAAWHSAHRPAVSEETIFAVNVDGTFNVLQAAREAKVKTFIFASSMAYGWTSVYGASKVLGEELCRAYHTMTGVPVVMLRYHDFVPKPYLRFGEMLLKNGVDCRDVAAATVASLRAALRGRVGLFRTVVHTDHGLPPRLVRNFRAGGLEWCERQVPGSRALIRKYGLAMPVSVEQHDLSEARRLLGWSPRISMAEFLRDLRERDARGEDVRALWSPGQIPEP